MFALFYVVLAPFVGAFADSLPKGRVMFISNTIKIVGCLLMLFGGHPLLAYAVVGLGAAAYSPAKYGILTELLPPSQLVKGNGWIEGLTVGSIILGMVLGGQLVGPRIAPALLGLDLPLIDTGIDTRRRRPSRADRLPLRASRRPSTCTSRAPTRRCSR
jgi:LPLT family lysophospholipid transporter-like MFS transporter